MRCGWMLVFVLVQTLASNLGNSFVMNLKNITITNNCRLYLKLLLDNLPLVEWNSLDVPEASNFTKCYNVEYGNSTINAECYFKQTVVASIASDRAHNNWTFIQKLFSNNDGVNNTRDFAVIYQNFTDNRLQPVCLPASCTNEDVRTIFQSIIGKEITICHNNDDAIPAVKNDIIIGVVIIFWFILMIAVSTIYDIYCQINALEPFHECLVAFSLHKNGKKVFKTTRNSSELLCLNGIRVISMIWVIILHTSSEICFAYFSESEELIQWENTWGSMLIRSGIFAVDSFLTVGGTLLSYTFMSKRTKLLNEKFNLFHHYLHRYIRLTPSLAAAVLVSSTLLTDAGSPKYRNILNWRLSDPCQKYWWSSLLYIQNYFNVEDMCLGHTWYLSTDMQLYIISPLLLLPLWKKRKMGLVLLALCITISVGVPFYIAYENSLRGVHGIISHDETNEDTKKYLSEYYFRTHTRATPWFIGILLGYVLFEIKFGNIKKPKMNKVTVVFLWAICLVVMLICIYCGHTLQGPKYDRLGNSFFIAFSKVAWSLCIVWVTFACAVGYGGPINWILSNSVNQILITFTYSMYILHLPVIYVTEYSSDVARTSFSILNMLCASFNVFILSLGLSVLWVLAFESPMTILEKHILKR